MPDYRKMYTTLFNGVTDAIDTLQSAQQETEEMYLGASEPDIRFVEPRPKTENPDAGAGDGEPDDQNGGPGED